MIRNMNLNKLARMRFMPKSSIVIIYQASTILFFTNFTKKKKYLRAGTNHLTFLEACHHIP